MTGVKFLKSVHSKNGILELQGWTSMPLKTVWFNVRDHIKSAHTPIILHRVLCRSLKKRLVGAYVDLAPHCI